MDFTGAGTDQLLLPTSNPIIINGNSTWLSPANGTTIVNTAGATIPIDVALGVTFTNGIALASNSAFGYRINGGGTLFQNSDATNVVGMTAPLTVLQSTLRVTDASSNGGVGNFGTGTFTLDGGTFDYAGTTATTIKPIALTANGATVQVESATTTLTETGAIAGPGPLTKMGPGTLVLGSASNSFTSLTINAGTIQTANDNTLGTGPVTINALGTLTYIGTTTTARNFTINSGRLGVTAGQTLTLSGGSVGGGFLTGPGMVVVTGGSVLAGVTTLNSSVINQTGPASFVDITNGGALTVAAGLAGPAVFSGFTNQGSGSFTVGAVSVVNVADFQSYGTLTLTPAVVGSGQQTLMTNTGTSAMFFNGGSRTFSARRRRPRPADSRHLWPGWTWKGKNAVIAGGLFVNNGFVVGSRAAASREASSSISGPYIKGRDSRACRLSRKTAARCRRATAPARLRSVSSSSAPAA